MKSLNIRLVSFLTAMTIVVLASVSAPATIHAQSQMALKIPFDFYVGNQQFELGDYTVVVSGAYIKIADGRGHSMFALTNPVANHRQKGPAAGALVFTRYDNYFFLSEVRMSGYSSANGLLMAPLEILVASNSAIKEKIAFQSGH